MVPSSTDISGETSIGQYLRQVRESQGKSLDDAAKVTRIGKNYLIAIEEDSYARLPNPAYLKGFLRIYASYLNISGDQLIARYEATTASGRGGASTPAADREEKKEVGRWWVVPLVLLILIIATATFMSTPESRQENKPVPAQTVTEPLPTPLQKPVSSATLAKPAPTIPGATGEIRAPASEAGINGIILKLKVNQDSTLNITIDGSISQLYDLKAGDLIEWKGTKSFSLDMSNAGGIEAEFNGKIIPPFGPPGKPAHVVLSGTTP